MNQPNWKFVANLGDSNPLDYDGYFIYEDETGVYPPEAEYLKLDNLSTYTIYRICLEPCTFINGILSDNKFHPENPAWFAQPEERRKERPQDSTYLQNVADYVGLLVNELINQFCSSNSCERANAYRSVAYYHGWDNLDSYPLTGFALEEVKQRYKEKELGK